jgi:hypothetical protein
MAKISTYPSADTPLLLSDRLIGTEAIREIPSPTPLATKNFSLGELLTLFSSNFPAASLQEVLNTGNAATQDIYLTGTLEVDLIKPVNIEDTSGSQGTTFQYLSKGTSSISWVTLPVDGLQAVLDKQNTATQNITLVGNVTSTLVTPNNIKDETSNLGSTGQVLTKTATGIVWADSSVPFAPSLADVLTTGNTATNDINLTGDMNATTFVKSGGTSSQFLKADGSVDSTAYAPSSSLPTTTRDLINNGDDGINPFISLADVPAQVNADWNATSGVAEILNKPTIGSGTVTSVALTMPSAFSVANSPITSSGSLDVTGAGTVSQYVRGDGSLANFPSSTGGGASLSFYLNGSVAQGTFGGISFKEMDRTPILGAGTDFTIATNGYIQSFITDANVPNQLEIPAGNWNFETYFSSSSSGGTPSFYIELYKWDGATLSLIASNSATPEGITNGTVTDLYVSALAIPQTTLALTDRLAVRIYVNNSGRTIKLHTEDNHLCQVITTFSTGLTALNGLTAQVQNFATGTSGTDFGISSATSTHTFNLPTASAVNRGALSSTDWTTFNGKFNLPALTSGSVLFSNGTTIAQDNANLFFDDTNNRLGIGTATPTKALTVKANANDEGILLQSSTGGTLFQVTRDGASNNTAEMFLYAGGAIRLAIRSTANFSYFNGGNFGIGTTTDAGFKLDVNGTARVSGALTAAVGISSGDTVTFSNTGNVSRTGFSFASYSNSLTTGALTGYNTTFSFNPSSGSATYTGFHFNTTIAQSGSASGITRGIYIQPAISNAADFRAIETTAGNVLFGASGTGFFWDNTNARLGIGTATPSSYYAKKLVVVAPDEDGVTIVANTTSSSSYLAFADGTTGNQAYRGYVSYKHLSDQLAFGSAGSLRMTIASTGNVLINTTTDVASSKLTIESTTQGFLPPRMTTIQKNAIASPATGLMVYDTTLNLISVYNGTMWISL